MDIEKVAVAIEADLGDLLPHLRQALAEANASLESVTFHKQVHCRQPHQKVGLMSQISQTVSAKFT